ncbi:MAG: hypothetical protein HQL32_12785 [Planctomycetes bacterium]|nr:hypothetical protein [Planctomycetota bacterium]
MPSIDAGNKLKNQTGEGKFLKSISEDSKAQIRCLMSHKNPSYSRAALGMLLAASEINEKNMTAIAAYASRGNAFHHVALLTSLSAHRDKCVSHFLKLKDHGKTLAAATLAASAIQPFIIKNINERVSANSSELNEKKGKKSSKGKRKKKNRLADNNVNISPISKELVGKLLQEKSTRVQRYAILIAAYSKMDSLKNSIMSLPSQKKSKDIMGASLLYLAMIGEKPEKEWIEAVFKSCSKISKAISRECAQLSEVDLLVPPLASACEALGYVEGDYLHLLESALKSKDIRVQMDATRAIARRYGQKGSEVLVPFISKASWPLLVEICNALNVNPIKSAVEPLIARYEGEYGLMRLHLSHALNITAHKNISFKANDAEKWWQDNQSDFQVDLAASKEYQGANPFTSLEVDPVITTFYMLNVFSDSFLYVVDTSASMKGNRIASLRENLVYSLKEMKRGGRYNIVDFGGDIVRMYKGLTSDIQKGIYRANSMPLSAPTRSFDTLEQAIKTEGVDSLIFLSDGAPTGYQLKSWTDIQSAIALINRYRPIQIQMIEFGAGKSARMHMDTISGQHYGMCESVFIEAEPDAGL